MQGIMRFNRAIIQIKGVHVIRHLHKTEKNSFDHIIARMSAENHIAIDIDLRPLVMSRGVWRQKAIQRYKDITGLCERFEFPLTLSSNARSVVELKSVREMVNLASLVGIEEPDAREALATINGLIAPQWPRAGGRMRPRPPSMRDKRRYVLVRITPSWLCPDTKSLYLVVQEAITSLWGDAIAADIQMAVVYGDKEFCIIRCRRGCEGRLETALSTVSCMNEQGISLRSYAVSGTIHALKQRIEKVQKGTCSRCKRA